MATRTTGRTPLPLRIDVHLHHHGLDGLCAGLSGIKEQIMAVSAQIAAFSARVDAATNEIAADLKALRDKLADGGLSTEDQAALDALAVRLEAVGADPENPTPGV